MREGTEEILDKLGPNWQASVKKAITSSERSDLVSFGRKVDILQIEINEFRNGSKGNVINFRNRLNELEKDLRGKKSPGYQQKIERMFEQLDDLRH